MSLTAISTTSILTKLCCVHFKYISSSLLFVSSLQRLDKHLVIFCKHVCMHTTNEVLSIFPIIVLYPVSGAFLSIYPIIAALSCQCCFIVCNPVKILLFEFRGREDIWTPHSQTGSKVMYFAMLKHE